MKTVIESQLTNAHCWNCMKEWECKVSECKTMPCPKCGDVPDKKPEDVKPAYTQEMADNGVLPAVGMECLVYELSSNEFHKCTLLMIHKKTFVWDPEGWHCAFTTSDSISIMPLTTTIELIDEKAYQFDARGKTLIGIYDASEKTLNIHQGYYFDLLSATNIKGPLTV